MWSFLFPPTCLGCGRLLRHARPLALCTGCEADQEPASSVEPDIAAPFAYHGPLGRAVVRLKFGGALALAGPLGRLLADQPEFAEAWDHVIAVPLHRRRKLQRGFDQSEELARAALRQVDGRFVRLLRRVRATQPQSDLDRRERALNVAGAFRVIDPARVQGRRILVIDDVTTTGATLRACLQALRTAGAKQVRGLALLRGGDDA